MGLSLSPSDHLPHSATGSYSTKTDGLRNVAVSAPATGTAAVASPPIPVEKPNIVLIYTDDVGYGDIGCYGASCVATPNIDGLAMRGLRFTDAHSTAAVCTPSRYSVLTGRYAFREPNAQILPGDAPLLISPSAVTLPRLLQGSGYATAAIGKWHLGLGMGQIDWNEPIAPGPEEIGFDKSFIIPATPDRVPCVYVEDGKVANLDPADPLSISYTHKIGRDPTGAENPELLRYPADAQHSGVIVDHISRIGWMSGGNSARWTDETMAEVLTRQAQSFIEQNHARPFFLYFALNDVHVPRAPAPRFVGTSRCGLRGDSLNEMDWSVGQIIETLNRLKLAENTLIIFSSDNGPVVLDGYQDGSAARLNGHKPAGPYRGGKYEIYEGGTRLPFITCWPGHIQPGVSTALIGQQDLLSSLAALTGASNSPIPATDSLNLLPALLGASSSGRLALVEQATTDLAIREGRWKYIPAPLQEATQMLEEGDLPASKPTPGNQLYDVEADPGETRNVIGDHEDIAQRLGMLLADKQKNPEVRP